MRAMAILIGVDERGYGRSYGPLANAATAWRLEEGLEVQSSGVMKKKGPGVSSQQSANKMRAGASSPPAPKRPQLPASIDLYKLLKKSVVRSPQECAKRIAIADSKQLYKPGQGLRQLERGVLAALMAT